MKFSNAGKKTILAVTCLGIGFILGQMNMEKAINLPGMKEGHVFGVHMSYMRGCVENKSPDTTWEKCVEGAKATANDVREIMDKEPLTNEMAPPPARKKPTKEKSRPSREGETAITKEEFDLILDKSKGYTI